MAITPINMLISPDGYHPYEPTNISLVSSVTDHSETCDFSLEVLHLREIKCATSSSVALQRRHIRTVCSGGTSMAQVRVPCGVLLIRISVISATKGTFHVLL